MRRRRPVADCGHLPGRQALGHAVFPVLDLEDFIVSNNLLLLGGLVFVLFCTRRFGWGWDKFTAEADEGRGPRFPKWSRFYLTWVLPALILVLFVSGYVEKFGK